MQRIFVTGAAGYIGSRLVPVLESHYDVVSLDLGVYGLDRSFPVEQGNIEDVSESDLAGVFAVINLASVSTDPMAELAPDLTYRYNAEAAVHLAEVARAAGVRRFVQASTCSVYGRGGRGMTEDMACQVDSAYGRSKLQAEEGIQAVAGADMDVVILRKGTVCGASPRFRSDLIVNTMTVTALTEGVIRVFDASAVRPVLYIGDAVQAYCMALVNRPGLYNLAYPLSYEVGTVAAMVASRLLSLTGDAPEVEYLGGEEVRSYGVDTSLLRNEWGWQPAVSVSGIVDSVWAELPLDPCAGRYKNIEGWLAWLENQAT